LNTLNQLIELQQRLAVNNPETSYLVKELNLLPDANGNKAELSTPQKRKREQDEDDDEIDEDEDDEDEDADDDDDDNEEDGDEDEEDEDNEEIYSDTDEEMRADDIKKAKKQKKLGKFEFTALREDQFEDYLAKFNQSFHKYK
jgi:hypothetical protein